MEQAAAGQFIASGYAVAPLEKREANALVVRHHYLHRRPSNSHSYGLISDAGDVLGVVIFGAPASRHVQMGARPANPDGVMELNRLWVDDRLGRNAESFFVSRALGQLPACLVVSYSDTKWDHIGTVYRALNFRYAGWTDMERRTPRYDYIPPDGKHTRDAWRGPDGAQWTHRVRRKPKAKYWIPTGNRRERAQVTRECGWPSLDWREFPVPFEHMQFPGPEALTLPN